MMRQENGEGYINTELNYLYGKPGIIRKIKSHRLRWAGHVVRMGDER